MTVHNQQKVMKKLINDYNQMIRDHEQNDLDNDETQNATTEIFGPIEDSNVDGDVIPNFMATEVNETYMAPAYRNPNEFEPLSRYYFREWTEVEHLYRLAVHPERRIFWSPSLPSPPPPQPFGINSDLITENPFEEENLQDLACVLDNIMLSAPGPDRPNVEYGNVNIYHHTDPTVPPNDVWIDASPPNEEPRPGTGSDCSYTP